MTVVFRGYDAKRTCNKKLKVLKEILPTLKDEFEAETKKKVDPLPSFIVAKMH